MLDACGPRLERRFGAGSVTLKRSGDQWRVIDAQGAVIAEAPSVIVANGGGATALAQAATLPLIQVRGQVTHLAAEALPDLGVVLCREAYITPAVQGVRSVGATYEEDLDPELRASSQRDNLDKLRSMLDDPALANDAPLAGRVGFRSVAPDRLPLVGALPDPHHTAGTERLRELPRQPGLYGLLGYASRGLTWAPLAAELLAATLEGEPLPLEANLAGALDPGRFQLRQRRAGRTVPQL
jgi:tRNA 5-methylaminomethyl-2-thiouridine biosynthesis bifunctional protein